MIVVEISSELNLEDKLNEILNIRKLGAEKACTTEELLSYWSCEKVNEKIVEYIHNEVFDAGYKFLTDIGLSFEDILRCTDKAKRLYTALYLNWLVSRFFDVAEQ